MCLDRLVVPYAQTAVKPQDKKQLHASGEGALANLDHATFISSMCDFVYE